MKERLSLIVNLVYAALLVAVAVGPSLREAEAGGLDGVAHAGAYGLQAGLLLWLFGRSALAARAAAAFAGAVFFGVFTECLQLLVSHRHFEWKDILADAAGSAVVVLVAVVVARARRDRQAAEHEV